MTDADAQAEPTLWRDIQLDDETIDQLRRLLFGRPVSTSATTRQSDAAA
jgi:hypothetical protein